MSESDKTPSLMPFWLMLLIGAAAAGLGYMLANGVMPFQALPLEQHDISRGWFPLLLAWALLTLMTLVVGLKSGCQAVCGTVLGKLRAIGPALAHWIAPHLAAAAAEANTLGKEAASKQAGAQEAHAGPQVAAPAPVVKVVEKSPVAVAAGPGAAKNA